MGKYLQISRQFTVHGVVDVKVIESPTRYGPAETASFAVSVVAARAAGTASTTKAAASAARASRALFALRTSTTRVRERGGTAIEDTPLSPEKRGRNSSCKVA